MLSTRSRSLKAPRRQGCSDAPGPRQLLDSEVSASSSGRWRSRVPTDGLPTGRRPAIPGWRAPRVEDGLHAIGSSADLLVLPDPDHQPPGNTQPLVCVAVAGDVACELGGPPVLVRLRVCRMYRASMPEAAVDEHCDSRAGEGNVGAPPTQSIDVEPVVDTEPPTAAVEFPAQSPLRRGARACLPRHASADVRTARLHGHAPYDYGGSFP